MESYDRSPSKLVDQFLASRPGCDVPRHALEHETHLQLKAGRSEADVFVALQVLCSSSLIPLWVGDFITMHPDAEYLRDDLEGEAGVKLMEVIADRPDAPPAYIRQAVLRVMTDAVCEAGLIPVPRRTAAGMIDRGEHVPGFARLPDDALDDLTDPGNPAALAELVEELEAHCRDDLDREIVAGMQTESFGEIAERLGIGKTTVAERWQTISEKFRSRAER